MKIRIIGGGPAGLYFGLLMKRNDPSHDVRVYERGRRDSTWGFGVVFSDQALAALRRDDDVTYELLRPHMESWRDLTIVHQERVTIAGNGFASIGRLKLLNVLQEEAERHAVELEFDRSVDPSDFTSADLVVAADGAFSSVRDANPLRFGTTVDWRTNRFAWFGTTKPFDTLTLTFRTTDDGVFCAHHYRYAPDMSTFLIEVDAPTFERARLGEMDEASAIRYCERVFADDLDGHSLLSNRTIWRTFPVIWNEHWGDGNVVLIGDALRTVHFSIGSGTRMAMEDAIALATACRDTTDIPAALLRFKNLRLAPASRIFDAAGHSLRWYEQMNEHMSLEPIELAYRYMRRSGRIDHAGVLRQDPELARQFEILHPETAH